MLVLEMDFVLIIVVDLKRDSGLISNDFLIESGNGLRSSRSTGRSSFCNQTALNTKGSMLLVASASWFNILLLSCSIKLVFFYLSNGEENVDELIYQLFVHLYHLSIFIYPHLIIQ